MASDYASTDVPASFGDYRLNSGRIIRLCLAGPVLQTSVQYLITFSSRREVASDINHIISDTFVRTIVLDKCVTFCAILA